MKMTLSALAGLTVTLLYCSQRSTAGGMLHFLTIPSDAFPNYLYGDDDECRIACNGGFKFGNGTVYHVYISSNGYISMGDRPIYATPVIPGEIALVSPYGADINPRVSGVVQYTGFISNHSQMNTVNDFIQNQTGNYFNGTRMMVTDWSRVVVHDKPFETSTFQCILITDDFASYAVFIYKCRYLGWNSATIGWQASETLYEVHYLSGADSSLIGCRYSSTFSAIVYRLDETCDSDEFTCDNGNCVPESSICNRNNDCGDNSDEEQGCPCYLDEFKCDNGKCVHQLYICDGEDNCGDNSDEEQGCPCGLEEFICGNGKCVPQSNVCDNNNDCKNNNDEEGCDDEDDEDDDEESDDEGVEEDDKDDKDVTEKDGVNIGLVVGLPVGLFFLSVFISIIIMCVVACCVVHTRRRKVDQSRTQPSAEDSTTMISKKETTFTA